VVWLRAAVDVLAALTMMEPGMVLNEMSHRLAGGCQRGAGGGRGGAGGAGGRGVRCQVS
jgi:hypothetical protein